MSKLGISLASFALVCGAAAIAQEPGPAPTPWDTPEFRKQFLGSYGIHADVEPKVSPEERVLLEKIYPLMASDMDEAARQIEAGRGPDSTALFDFILGNIAFQQDRLDEAAAHYQGAVTRLPAFRRAWKNLGLVQMRQQQLDPAIHSFTQMIQLGGGDALSYGLLGYAYSARGDFLAAESAYRNALLLEPDNADYRIGLVRAAIKQEKYQEASGLLSVLLERQPERAEFWMLQANAFIGMQQPLRAAENYEVLSRMGRATVDSQNVLGDIYVNEGLPNLAASAYARGIDLDPAQPLDRPLRNIEVLVARDATAEAADLLERFRSVFGDRLDDEARSKALKLEARIALSRGEGDVAAAALEQVVALDPLDGDALLLLGQYHARSGAAEKALLCYERAGNLEAFEAQARVRQGQLLISLGRYDDGLRVLRRSQELKPTEQVARYIEQVERASRAAR